LSTQEPPLLNNDAGRLVPWYLVTNGRTQPTNQLDMLSTVKATGQDLPRLLGPEHFQALRACATPTSVLDVANRLRQPVVVAKIVLSDLIDRGVVTAQAPSAAFINPDVLERVLNGLQRMR
jgi:hypothetical protein